MNKLIVLLFVVILGSGCSSPKEEGVKSKGTKQTIEKEGEWGTLNVSYPVYDNRYVDSVINKFISKQTTEFMLLSGYAVEDKMKYEITAEYKEYFADPAILSVVFNIYQFTGGAHGNTFIQSFVFDTKNKKILGLNDFVTKEGFLKIRSLAREILKKKLDDSESVDYGTATVDEFSAFAVTNDKFIFWFSPYQVASYADGLQIVEIPRENE